MKRDKGKFIKGHHYSERTEFKKGQHWRSPKPFWEYEYLYHQYVELGKSSTEIAKEHGCGATNIIYWLRKHGIKIRSTSEARQLKYWGLHGADNPMYNKCGELNPNWKGGVTPERQAFYVSQEWKSACSEVWKRDEAKCQRCGGHHDDGVPIHVHHIVPFENKELRADVENLILLCDVCHNWVHSNGNIEKEFLGGD